MADVDLQQLAIDRTPTTDRVAAPRRNLGTRVVVPGLLAAALIAVVVWGAWDWVFPPRPVKVIPVFASRSTMRTAGTPLFQAAGWVEPRPTPIRIAALAPGVIEELLVVEDQPVKKGDPVAKLVREDAQLVYERALADEKLRQAEVEQAQARLQGANVRLKQPVHLEAALAEAEAQLSRTNTLLQNLPFEVRRAEAKQQFAQQNYDRQQAAKAAVSKLTIEQALSDLETAKATVEELKLRRTTLESEQAAWSLRRDALKTQLKLLVDEIESQQSAEAMLHSAEAKLKQAEVVVDEAKLRLDRMVVRAPVDGRIYQLLSPPGAHLGMMPSSRSEADSSTVVSMYRPESLQVRVDVRFEDIPKVSLDQEVQINNPALPEPIVGKVLFVSSEADIQKNTLQVKVAMPEPPRTFKPEMLVDVTFLSPKPAEGAETPSSEIRIYVPSELVQHTEDKTFVWIADRYAGSAHQRTVTLGAESDSGLVEVTQGLNLADRLIASSINELSEATRIQVVGEDDRFAQQIGQTARGEK